LNKKNLFSENYDRKKNHFDISKNKLENNLDQLRQQNENLEREIKFLEEKNRRLRIKIEKMKRIINDLQEQKLQLEKSEKRLLKLREQKDEALAMVAHDLKNPASTIKNFVELLESYDLSAQEQHDVFAGLMETSSRLVRLADEFTQVISEKYVPFTLNKKQSNLKEIVEGIVKINHIKAKEKNIEIRLYQPEYDIEINLDPEKIKEVVDNFVSNAIKFCPEKSKVEIHTKLISNEVTIEVKDNGYGLTEEEVIYAFEKGIKLSTKPTGGESSSGLGLWIAKRIVEAHDGRVFVKSKKGLGSTFTFVLPMK
jgi:signal transduction histidine kinase